MSNDLIDLDDYLPLKPLFSENVWVGFISEIGFVVFDPFIYNLFLWNKEQEVCLWVLATQTRQYFIVSKAREMLRENLGKISIEVKQNAAIRYWIWFNKTSADSADEDIVGSYGIDDRLSVEWSSDKQAEDLMPDEEYYLRNR